jgi:hypothetical protein
MTFRTTAATSTVWCATALILLGVGQGIVSAADMRFDARLIWGTDDPKPPEGKNYHPAEAEVVKKLKDLPLKWNNWFVVNRTNFSARSGAPRRVMLSDKCELDVRNLGNDTVEIVLIGKGKEVVKRTQAFAMADTVVLGGNAPNSTAWLVFLKRIEPRTAQTNALPQVQSQASPKAASTPGPVAVPRSGFKN